MPAHAPAWSVDRATSVLEIGAIMSHRSLIPHLLYLPAICCLVIYSWTARSNSSDREETSTAIQGPIQPQDAHPERIAQPVSAVVRTQRLEVIDRDDRTRILLSGEDENSTLMLLYKPGTLEPRMQLATDSSGGASVRVLGGDGKVRFVLLVSSATNSVSTLTLVDGSGRRSIGFTLVEGAEPEFEIGRDDLSLCAISAASDGGEVILRDSEGKVTERLPRAK